MTIQATYKRLSGAVAQASQIMMALGPRWVWARVSNEIALRSGWQKRKTRPLGWPAYEEEGSDGWPLWGGGVRFFFGPGVIPDLSGFSLATPAAMASADAVCEGFLQVHAHMRALYQNPPRWLYNPKTDRVWSAQQHWTDTPTFDASLGDIKEVWSASRFSWVFELVRAHARAPHARYAHTFWHFLESWCDANPPQMGPNWKCGQETALRAMAVLFGAVAFGGSEAATGARKRRLIALLNASAIRIESYIHYALSQKNNHGISEAAGLLSIGLMLPELSASERWVVLGKGLIERELARQVYGDGSYVQHSMNYHRVLLHLGIWIARLTAIHNTPMSLVFYEKMRAAARFMRQMLDEASGLVPNYGGNDGALLFPLSGEAYWDYRPTVQMASQCFEGFRALPDGLWDESARWFLGSARERASAPYEPIQSTVFLDGGYGTLRGGAGDSWCMIRCHSYRDRPSHVDMLHVDLWWRGLNVLPDGGTFRYFDPQNQAIIDGLKDMRGHNTLEINGQGPLQMVTRFLWLPWPGGRFLEVGEDVIEGEHDGYVRLGVKHRRRLERTRRGWRVRDEVGGGGGGGTWDVKVRWRLHPSVGWQFEGDNAGVIRSEVGTVRVTFSAENSPEAWKVTTEEAFYSLYYGEFERTQALVFGGRAALPVAIITDIVFED